MALPTPTEGESQSSFLARFAASKEAVDEFPDKKQRVVHAFGKWADARAASKLTTEERDKLPDKDFALGDGRYPIPDKSHARNALARVSQHGTPAEKAEVRKKVKDKFGIGNE